MNNKNADLKKLRDVHRGVNNSPINKHISVAITIYLEELCFWE